MIQIGSISQNIHANGQKIAIGRKLLSKKMGFGNDLTGSSSAALPIYLPPEGHVAVCSPTGGGKFLSSIAMILSQHIGSAIVFDVTGASAQVWARYRRDLGQKVTVIDPFRTICDRSDGINLFEYFDLAGASLDSDCESLAAILGSGHEMLSDVYWSDAARGFVSGLLRFTASLPKSQRDISTFRRMIHNPDLDAQIHVLLASGEVTSTMAEEEFAAYLTAPADKTRPCILSTAQTFVKSLGGPECRDALQSGTLSLCDLVDGPPQTVFIVAPQNRLVSHRNFWRLLFEILASAVFRRQQIPSEPTFLILDEAAAIGELPTLKQVICMGRAAGIRVLTAWQDLSQIQAIYKSEWQTVLNNHRAIQVFGMHNHLMAHAWSDVLGCSVFELMSMSPDQQMISLAHEGLVRCTRLNYLRDPEFIGMYDPNPRYATR